MKKFIPIIVLTLAGTLMVAYNSLGQENKWTLEECVLYAIEHNIQVKQQELAADVQQNALKQSKYNLAPSLNGGAGHLKRGQDYILIALKQSKYNLAPSLNVRHLHLKRGQDYILIALKHSVEHQQQAPAA